MKQKLSISLALTVCACGLAILFTSGCSDKNSPPTAATPPTKPPETPGETQEPIPEEDVAFFKRKHQKKITGVKPKGEYSDPDQFYSAMKSYTGGMQLHCTGGFKAKYAIEVSRAGKYVLAARVATVQEGQKFQLAANDAKGPVAIAVPYTIGLWQQTQPVEISLVNGKNVIRFALQDGSRGVTIKEFTLTSVK